MLQQFPVIVGPTAGGKSALAVQLAHGLERTGRPPAEIVTADSMQVYRSMDIGTAKPSRSERRGIVHHLIDIAEPSESFSVDRWLKLANPTIDDIRARGRTPIVVGGSHLYIQSLLYGLFEGPAADEALRTSLAQMPLAELRAELERIDPDAAARIHANDLRRTVRALEVFRLTGTPLSALQQQWDRRPPRADALLIGLDWPAAVLNQRINARVQSMIKRGLVGEARGLWESGSIGPQARVALGYRQLFEHFGGSEGGEGGLTLDRAIEKIKIETRRFAKNQRTWLRRLRMTPGSLWLDACGSEGHISAQDLASQVLAQLGESR